MRKYPPEVSPERARPWSEPLPKLQHGRKVSVVYYLCRNSHLEHPHFIEVCLSSPDGLYLKDVIERLNVLRGKGMGGMYAWSCKRSYKTGFVWHDLEEDDLVVPASGNEYVLKGSEILDQSHGSDRRFNRGSFVKLECSQPVRRNAGLKPPPRPLHSSSSSSTGCSDDGAGSSVEFQACNPSSAQDAATQTEEGRKKETCDRGMWTEDSSVDKQKQRSEIEREEISPLLSERKVETLESLIRAEVKMNSFRISEGDQMLVSTRTRLRASNVLMHLITCGSISVKDHRSRFSRMKFTPTMLRGSGMLGELDCLSDNPKLTGLRLEDKEYFSGSLIETNRHREEAVADVSALKRSSSFNADRHCTSPDSKREKELPMDSSRSKCLPKTIKIMSNKQSRNATMRSPTSEAPRTSSALLESSKSSPLCSSKGGSSRIMTDASSQKGSSMRLTSGARVIIQSTAICDDKEDISCSS
ncbi:putative protein SOSEKI [Dioscorea sansibarensis]